MTMTVTIKYTEGAISKEEHLSVSDKALDCVLFNFNPDDNPVVFRQKALAAAFMTSVENVAADPESSGAKKRCAALAVTHAEIAAMFAVKSNFAK